MKYTAKGVKKYFKQEKILGKEIAKILGLTETTISRKLKAGSFTRNEIVMILNHCNNKEEGIKRIFPEIFDEQ